MNIFSYYEISFIEGLKENKMNTPPAPEIIKLDAKSKDQY